MGSCGCAYAWCVLLVDLENWAGVLQIVLVRVLAAYPDGRTEDILRSNWFTIKRSGPPNYQLCGVSTDGLRFPSIYNTTAS